nr:MAG TPA: hypothetical protein [Bacteriophage sp.]
MEVLGVKYKTQVIGLVLAALSLVSYDYYPYRITVPTTSGGIYKDDTGAGKAKS